MQKPYKSTEGYIIKRVKVREFLHEHQIGDETMSYIDKVFKEVLLKASERCKKNRRTRIYPMDL